MSAVIARARAVIGQLDQQSARFSKCARCYEGAGNGNGNGNGSESGSDDRLAETEGSSSSMAVAPAIKSREKRRRKSARPSWLCVPQCSRRSAQHPRCDRRPRRPGNQLIPSNRRNHVGDRTPSKTRQAPAPPPAPASASASNDDEAVHAFVARQVRDIMEKAAINMAALKLSSSGPPAAGDVGAADLDRVKLLRCQMMRAATYTAVCRRLEHALELYGETIPYRAPSATRSLRSFASHNDREEQHCRQTHIADLPKSALLAIFSMLEQRDLAVSVAPVCRQWRMLARHRSLWRHLQLDWSAESDAGLSRVPAACALIEATPGLWTLELVGCAHIDHLLGQVIKSCRRLRTLAIDSCHVSDNVKTSCDSPCVLSELLTQCSDVDTLIVAFTPRLTTPSFFRILGSRCWRIKCFLVSADVSDTRIFLEAASLHAPGAARRRPSASGSLNRNPNPNRVTDIRTDSFADPLGSALLQWRLYRDHANAAYFGINVRVGLA